MKLETEGTKNEKVKKRSLVKYIYLLLVFTIILCFGSCENDLADPITVTQDVTANFPAFVSGNTINFTPTYTPKNGTWEDHFSVTDTTGITYIVNC